MNGEYATDRQWSDIFIPAMKQVIGPYLLTTSSFDQDTQRATDLVVLGVANKQIACRVRRPGFYDKYGNQFTIRYERASGTQTEFEKIAKGFADWMFYGHAADNNGNLRWWWLLNLDVFRKIFREHKANTIRDGITPNRDGTTSFAWFDIMSFPRDLVVASGSYQQIK